MRRSRAAALALVLAGVLGAPATAGAHATLEGTSPQRGATVAREPAQVVFRFDEAVEGNFGAVRVFDSRGERVDQGDAFHPGGSGSRLGVHLRPGLPQGTYTATYRVVSADGHIVSSGFVFSIGHATTAGATVADLLGRSGTGAVTSTAFGAARAIQYAALAIGGGAIAFLLLVWAAAGAEGGAGEAFSRRLRLLVVGAAVAGVVSGVAGLVLEAAEAAGETAWSALRPHVLREVLGTRFGTWWAIGIACWLVVGLLGALLLRRPAPHRSVALLVVPLGFLLTVPAFSGHGTTQSPVAVLFPANVLHVAAMTVWLGGLACLLVAVPAATRRLEGTARTRLLAGIVSRFSALALVCVAVLLVSGLLQAYLEIRHLDLVFSTAFGRAAFIKLVLLALLVGLGALNRRRTVPRLVAAAREGGTPGAAGVTLRRTLRGEVALIAVVLGVTGALAGYAPATAVQRGPFAATTRVGPDQLQITVDPARVGPNEIHLYLIDPRSGAQVDRAKEVTLRASLPAKRIGAMVVEASKAGPGHYVTQGLVLGVAGTWQLDVDVRVSAFDEYSARLEVPVR